MGNGTVIYIGNFRLPPNNAAGQRVLNNAKLLKELGYDVMLIGLNNSLDSDLETIKTKMIYDDIVTYSLPLPKNNLSWLNYKKQFNKTLEIIEKVISIKCLIMYGCPSISIFGLLLKKWAKKRDVKLLADVVEWHSVSGNNLPYKIVKKIDLIYYRSYLCSKIDGVIAISKFLKSYYSNKGVPTIVLPPLVDCENKSKVDKSQSLISLIYVGTPFSSRIKNNSPENFKDRLDKVIECLNYISEEYNLEFIFNIYGLTGREYLSAMPSHSGLLENLKTKVFFHGFVTQVEALEKISESDFCIFFRDVNKVTTAGFPTKFSESISCGTPVITTNTSDIKDYLLEGENGYFIDIDDTQKMTQKMNYILTLSKEHINNMKDNAFNSKLFDYRNYKNIIEDFLNSNKF